mmetsp:Transcript_93764/g.264781  ORF Transcript_93764/g.264781 Transcript_93764/m.264781 type:complete len:220 (-) Transcript_93764:285-944(-)
MCHLGRRLCGQHGRGVLERRRGEAPRASLEPRHRIDLDHVRHLLNARPRWRRAQGRGDEPNVWRQRRGRRRGGVRDGSFDVRVLLRDEPQPLFLDLDGQSDDLLQRGFVATFLRVDGLSCLLGPGVGGFFVKLPIFPEAMRNRGRHHLVGNEGMFVLGDIGADDLTREVRVVLGHHRLESQEVVDAQKLLNEYVVELLVLTKAIHAKALEHFWRDRNLQ